MTDHTPAMPTRTFAGTPVGAVGLGLMTMSQGYDLAERDDEVSVALIHEALDLGVTFLDTAQVYGGGHNESLLGRALAGVNRDRAVVATKTGLAGKSGSGPAPGRDGTPANVKGTAEDSLRRLGTDVIDLYYLHRVDPDVPLTETWGAMAELVAEGKVRHLGLSEVTVAQADEAHAVHPVAAIQSEMSLWTRDATGETGTSGDVVGWCAVNNATFVPFSPLGRGFLTGTITAPRFEDDDFRARNPRFQEEALKSNLRIVDVVKEVAARHDVTPAQVAIAWTLAQGDHIIPIPGTKKPRYLRENAAAASLRLTEDDLATLGSVPAPIGARY